MQYFSQLFQIRLPTSKCFILFIIPIYLQEGYKTKVVISGNGAYNYELVTIINNVGSGVKDLALPLVWDLGQVINLIGVRVVSASYYIWNPHNSA